MNQSRIMQKILNYKISLNSNARISRNKAFLILTLTAVLLIAAGLRWGDIIFGPPKISYYDYRIEELNKALQEYPEDRVLALELAMNLYLNGETRKGIKLARKIYQKHPDDRDALFYLGLMLSDRGEHREAIDILEEVVKLYPGHEPGKVHFYLGKSYYETDDYPKALTNLGQAVKREPGSPVSYFFLGRTHEKLGAPDKALEAYRQALLLAGNYPEAEAAVRRLSK